MSRPKPKELPLGAKGIDPSTNEPVKEGIRTRQQLKDDAITSINQCPLQQFDHTKIRCDTFMISLSLLILI